MASKPMKLLKSLKREYTDTIKKSTLLYKNSNVIMIDYHGDQKCFQIPWLKNLWNPQVPIVLQNEYMHLQYTVFTYYFVCK